MCHLIGHDDIHGVNLTPLAAAREKYFIQLIRICKLWMERARVCCGVYVEVKGQLLESILIVTFGAVFLI